jgi:hypothetical protein
MTTPHRTIHVLLAEAQGRIQAAQKSGNNKYDGYRYAKLEDYLEQAKPILADLGLSIVTGVDELIPLEDRTTAKGGKEHAVRVKVTGTVFGPGGDCVTASAYGEGQDRADKAIYKATTGARKYLIAGLLAIPTTDDPEADETVGTAQAPRVGKTDMQTGETVTRQPVPTAQQRTAVGVLNSMIVQGGGDGGRQAMEEQRARLKYTNLDEQLRQRMLLCQELGLAPDAEQQKVLADNGYPWQEPQP